MDIYPRKIDVVIPLGVGSKHNNMELRMALRSVERCVLDLGNIYIISDAAPDWLQTVKVIPVKDRHVRNKDANIIDKLLAAADRPELSQKFVFWSDDQFVLQPVALQLLPSVFNRRCRSDFNGDKIWHRRMRNTFDLLARKNIHLQYNFDSHVPQLMDKELFRKVMRSVDYTVAPGYCVNTLYFGLAKIPGVIPQERLKATVEKSAILPKLPADKLFIGCNDEAMLGNLPELLTEYFPEKSRCEKW